MPSISEQLQALGVKVGTHALSPSKPPKREDFPIAGVLPGEWWQTPEGDTFFVETRYKANAQIGNINLTPSGSMEIIAAYCGEPELAELDIEQYAFIDTETTGLAGGTGTYTFLIGVGRFEGEEFRLVQFFLQDPAEEIAQLSALNEFLAPSAALVSFNGKTFDIPLINTRYTINRWPSPIADLPHLDLLHLARRLWKARLDNCSLGNLEGTILGLKRSEQDVPGWMIGDLYFDYLHTGDARPLRGVFYHNEIDVVSLTALLNQIIKTTNEPLSIPFEYSLDLISIGKLYADLGLFEEATQIYQRGMEKGDLDESSFNSALQQLSYLHKKGRDYNLAIPLWEKAASLGHIYAHEELAKYYEHKAKNHSAALVWTEKALTRISEGMLPDFERTQWFEALKHRKNRLDRKLIK